MERQARILVIEDDPYLLRASVRLLEENHYEVFSAESGASGLDLARQIKPDLVLLDLIMPGMDGIEVCRRMKKDPALARTFVLMISSVYVGSEQQAAGLEAGADDYIVRPVSNREFVARVNAILRIKRAEDELRESEQRFKALFQGMPVPVYTWQHMGDDFVLVDHNEAADAITGGKIGDFVGMSATAMYPDRPDIVSDISRCFAERVSIQREMEYRFKTTGARKVLVAKYAFVPPDLVLVHTEDVTQRHRAEEALRESESRLELAVAGAEGGLWSMALDPDDPSHSVPEEIWLSPRLKALVGYGDDEFPNSMAAWESHVLPEDLPKLRESSQKYRQGEIDRYEVEYRFRHKDGGIRWLRTTGHVDRDSDGRPVRFAGIDWDISERKQAEERLRASEQFTQSSLDALSAHVAILDSSGTILAVNASWRRFADQNGLAWDDYGVGRNYLEATDVASGELSQGAREAATGIREMITRQREQFRLEYPCHSPDEKRWFVLRATRFESSGDVRVVTSHEDTTERRRAEQALQRERDLISRIMDTSPVGITVFDRQGRIIFANTLVEQQAALLGQSKLIGLAYRDHIWQFMTADGKPVGDEEHPFVRVMNTGQSLYDSRYVIEGQDGGRLFFSVSAAPLLDESGQISGVVATTEDITAREQARVELKASEEKYRDLVEKISDVIYALDTEGVVTYVNPASKALIGLSLEEVVGQPFDSFIHPEDLGRVQDSVQDLLSGRVSGPAEYRVLNASGETRWIRVTSQVIVDEGQVTGVQGVLTDVTERKRLDEQLAAAAAVAEQQRLARELHDSITQSLFLAASTAETLSRVWERDPGQTRQVISDLRRLTQGALAEMRTTLLELRPTDLTRLRLDVLLRQLTDGLMARTKMGVTVALEGSRPLPDEVQMALYRIAQEALNNIVKHSQADRAIVNLRCEPDQVVLCVRDDGVGFDPLSIEPGQMGLDIMRERSQAIDAEFVLESELGRGTEITVTWKDRNHHDLEGLFRNGS